MIESTSSSISPTKEKSGEIKAINKEAVHRICSGQVVLNLATAVKELVENSLDAGATVIEVRLREHGSELVEVSDNGSGVQEENFAGLTLKHHTSKLREFSDLMGVETFGFRGEALSSLCALSEMTVTTRHTTSVTATKLTYDSHGHISSKTYCARQIGTTVSLANLFSTLPVRQKEFLRNLKREFVKMTHLLYGYCLIASSVKISCINQTKTGGRTAVVSTTGSNSVKDNIGCIFGVKQVGSLLDLKEEVPSSELMEHLGLTMKPETVDCFRLNGCISSCAHGQGRSSADRQFFYINSRPCEPTKVAKVVNEVYHQFNLHQFPFVFLNITTDRSGVDVNVTPDKRQIFLDNEKLLLATIKASLLKLYESIPSTYQIQNVTPTRQRAVAVAASPSERTVSQSSPTNNQNISNGACRQGGLSALLRNFSRASPCSSPETRSPYNSRLPVELPTRGTKRVIEVDVDRSGKRQMSLTSFVKRGPISLSSPAKDTASLDLEESLETSDDGNASCPLEELEDNIIFVEQSTPFGNENTPNVLKTLGEGEEMDTSESQSRSNTQRSHKSLPVKVVVERPPVSEDPVKVLDATSPPPRGEAMESSYQSETAIKRNIFNSELTEKTSDDETPTLESGGIVCDEANDNVGEGRRGVSLHVDLTEITNKLKRRHRLKEKPSCKDKPVVKFYAEIDPNSNKNAEQELSREISKDMFARMVIVGQFNLGFIITHLGNDLFIVDQHATDEKYNFETLERTTVIQNQKLVIPQTLELTQVNESILVDNLDIFRNNGFDFIFDENGPPTRRVQLTAKPFSHNWEFGREDIDELLFMLSDAPQTMCRPSRVRAMFASRACRKSVMIGTALSKSDMRRLIDHMGQIEQPWNCPHGRPTMRHLVNLEMVRKS